MDSLLEYLPFLDQMLPHERKAFEEAIQNDAHLQKTVHNWRIVQATLAKRTQPHLPNPDLLTLFAIEQKYPQLLSPQEQAQLNIGKTHIQEALHRFPALQLVIKRLQADADFFQQQAAVVSQTEKPKIFRLYPWMRAAAIVLLCFGLGWLGYQQFVKAPTQLLNVQSSPFQTLPDGSTVKLAPNATLTISYTERLRQVHLNGKAYFDIKHLQQDKPFQVITSQAITQVLGTKFMVEGNAQQTTVHLIEGKVAFAPKNNPKHSTILKPGETVLVIQDRLVDNRRDAPIDLRWAGFWQFNNESFAAIAEQLVAEHKIDIQIAPELATERLNGTFPTTQNLESILNTLAMSVNAKVLQTPNGFKVIR